jgi:fluoroacetyl-CoA thioesterase
MKATLRPGLKVNFAYCVGADRTVPKLLPESAEFLNMPEVLATRCMVGLFEWACIAAINPHHDWPEEQTVGIHVNLSHVAATLPGLTMHVHGQLPRIDGRKLIFQVEVDDGGFI